jgi:hypothetical protein
MRKGRYYLGRISKLGRLTQDMIVETLLKSPIITVGKYAWAITDPLNNLEKSTPFIYGELSKFDREGFVTKVDITSNSKVNEEAKNLLIASSPFVYLPDFSGIAYLHIWNQIQKDVFPRRLKKIIEDSYNNFFVDCKVEAISDYTSFVAQIRKFSQFIEISAKVHPPNPLFGRLWKSLEEYIDERNVEEFSVSEESSEDSGINSRIQDLMANLLQDNQYSPNKLPSLTDAALLMAADGYGNGKVTGLIEGERKIVRTSETKLSFRFTKEPDPQELANKAWKEFEKINKERDMEHK